jgi:hypothetical protein
MVIFNSYVKLPEGRTPHHTAAIRALRASSGLAELRRALAEALELLALLRAGVAQRLAVNLITPAFIKPFGGADPKYVPIISIVYLLFPCYSPIVSLLVPYYFPLVPCCFSNISAFFPYKFPIVCLFVPYYFPVCSPFYIPRFSLLLPQSFTIITLLLP